MLICEWIEIKMDLIIVYYSTLVLGHLWIQVCNPPFTSINTMFYIDVLIYTKNIWDSVVLLLFLLTMMHFCHGQCSFVEHRNYKIVYRRYASLFFLVGVDDGEVIHCFYISHSSSCIQRRWLISNEQIVLNSLVLILLTSGLGFKCDRLSLACLKKPKEFSVVNSETWSS